MPKLSSLPPDSDPTTTDYVPVLDIETMTTKRSLLSSLITLFFNNIPTGTIKPVSLYAGANSSWVLQSWTPTLYNLTAGNGTVTAKYIQVGNIVYYYFNFVLGSTSGVGAFPNRFSLPLTMADNGAGTTFVAPSGFGQSKWWAYDISAVTTFVNSFGVLMNDTGGTFSIGTLANVTTTNPMTWASGDTLYITGYYLTA